MDRNSIITQALLLPSEAIRRGLTMALREADPTLQVSVIHDQVDECRRFAAKGHCTMECADGFAEDLRLGVHQGEMYSGSEVGWWEIVWEGQPVEMVHVPLDEGFQRAAFSLILSHSTEAIGGFLVALDRFSNEIDGAVLVFQDGCWRHDEELYEDIQNATFDNLVLPEGMSDRVRGDVQQWLDAKPLYERHGVPWKRGMIFVGPPGNGKTHMIKALVNHFEINALYVRGFSAEYQSDAANISSVFRRARECSPAMLIFEDLDTMVNPTNRSHFLNELDGFAKNSGILAIASANDPARLDPALVNRPSRFDRRHTFNLPEAAERTRYLAFFTSVLEPTLQLSEAEASALGTATEGFSYAYLKELVLSSMMAWISSDRSTAFAEVMARHTEPLLAQMELDPVPTPVSEEDESGGDEMQRMAMRMHRRMKR